MRTLGSAALTLAACLVGWAGWRAGEALTGWLALPELYLLIQPGAALAALMVAERLLDLFFRPHGGG
jgi:hypothetical protein